MIVPVIRVISTAIVAAAIAFSAPAAAAFAAPATALTSGVSDFTFDSFSADYYLDTDAEGHATMRVVETLVARFPDFDQNRGIIRAIPLSDGEVPLELSMVSITDEDGARVPYERDDYDGFAEFALGTDEFVHGRTVYVLEYTMKNPIRHFTDSGGDEFYWDVNGNGWGQTFGSVSARVFLSEGLAYALTGSASCYLGYYGDTDQCEITRGTDGASYETTVGPVGPYNTVTIAIGFAGDTVVQPQLPRDSWVVQLAPKILLAIQAVLAAIALLIRTVVWRDARGRGTIIAQYTPPKDSDLLIDANLIDRPYSGLPALFIDFAVRGMVKVIDTDPTSTLDRTRFSLEFVSSQGASTRESKVLVTLFGADPKPGKRVNPGALTAKAGASLFGLTASTARQVTSDGLRAVPGGTATKSLGRASFWVLAAFVPVWIWAVVFDVLGVGVVAFAVASGVLWLAVSIVLVKPSKLTRSGAEAKEYLLGLREYLTIAEEDRMRVLQSPEGAERVNVTDRGAVVKLNERLLSYAVLWGVEDRWAEELRAQYDGRTPSWLDADSFSPSMLSRFAIASRSSVAPIASSS
ncbi:MAG: DUF2207 domain-containing protein, partial [Rhodoglobus sp.]|nr:DUF2207 domain-containing protein [Rhodoglobus sp.]